MADVEIGIGKSGRRAYGFDDIAIVPSRRTRDPEEVDIGWEIDAFRFELPIMAPPAGQRRVAGHRRRARAASGASACCTSRGCGPATPIPSPSSRRSPGCPPTRPPAACRSSTASRCSPTWWASASASSRPAGHTVAVACTPQRTLGMAPYVLRAEPDLLVVQGTVVSAEHVSRQHEPLNLKDFIRHYEIPVVVGGCTSYQAALHLMRTGAAGVLVGAGSGAAGTTRRVLGRGHPDGHRHRRRPGRAHAAPRRDRRLRPRDRRRRHDHRRRHRQGHRVRRRRRDGRHAPRGRRRGARPRLPLGHHRRPRHPPAGPPRRGRASRHRWRRSSSAPPTRPTASATCSAPCAGRWPCAATSRSRTSRRPRWSPSHDHGVGSAGPRRRLRRAVRPADRPAGAGGSRLQRDRPPHDAGGGDAGPAARSR